MNTTPRITFTVLDASNSATITIMGNDNVPVSYVTLFDPRAIAQVIQMYRASRDPTYIGDLHVDVVGPPDVKSKCLDDVYAGVAKRYRDAFGTRRHPFAGLVVRKGEWQ